MRHAAAAALAALVLASVASAATSLPRGKYPCYGTGGYLFFDIVVTGAATYTSGNKPGRYALSGTKITFASGPLKGVNARLFEGPRIGMNMNGSSYYSTTCSLSR
jgi:hypothetical protein